MHSFLEDSSVVILICLAGVNLSGIFSAVFLIIESQVEIFFVPRKHSLEWRMMDLVIQESGV